jgi:hypothetical protein
MRELYELHDPQYADRYTVPVLWDSQTKKIVNNESSEIIRMFNTEFNAFAKVRPCTRALRVVSCLVLTWARSDDIRTRSWTCPRPRRGRRSMPSTSGCTRPSTTASTSADSPPRRLPVRSLSLAASRLALLCRLARERERELTSHRSHVETDEEAFHVLFATLDEAEEKLSKTRFLGGDKPNGTRAHKATSLFPLPECLLGSQSPSR